MDESDNVIKIRFISRGLDVEDKPSCTNQTLDRLIWNSERLGAEDVNFTEAQDFCLKRTLK